MYDTLTLDEIALRLRRQEITAEELTTWTLSNYTSHEAHFNAFKTRNPEQELQEARAADAVFATGISLGPLQGLPISIKDMFGVDGYPTFAGCSFPLPKAYGVEGPVVSRLRRQLGTVAGKTHTVQFAYGGLGANHNWGAPRNPWDATAHRSPGGSSSGAGVSIVTGMALAALGSDTAGSVRIPASATGICGMRPTKGRWSAEGIVPLAPAFDTAGPLARTMRDLRYVFAALDPARPLPPSPRTGDVLGLRMGVPPFLFESCDPGIAEAVEGALDELQRAGAILVDLNVPEFEAATEVFSKGGLHIGAFSSFIQNEAEAYFDDLDPIVKIRLENQPVCTAADHLHRARQLQDLASAMDQHWRTVDLIAGPTLPITPPIMEEVRDPEKHLSANMRLVRNTNAASLLGLCAMTLPVGFDAQRMPVGMQMMSRPNSDQDLIDRACAIEAVLGPGDQRMGRPPEALM